MNPGYSCRHSGRRSFPGQSRVMTSFSSASDIVNFRLPLITLSTPQPTAVDDSCVPALPSLGCPQQNTLPSVGHQHQGHIARMHSGCSLRTGKLTGISLPVSVLPVDCCAFFITLYLHNLTTRLKFGERCSSHAGPKAWNNLPHAIQ